VTILRFWLVLLVAVSSASYADRTCIRMAPGKDGIYCNADPFNPTKADKAKIKRNGCRFDRTCHPS
jgi:hypothetical protein